MKPRLHRSTSRTPRAELPPEAEWNFGIKGTNNPLPPDQLEPCMYYEYARESPTIRAMVEAFRSEWEERKAVEGTTPRSLRYAAGESGVLTTTADDELAQRLHRALAAKNMMLAAPVSPVALFPMYDHCWWCVLWPEWFPHAPWTSIPEPERRARVKLFTRTTPAVEEIGYEEFSKMIVKDGERDESEEKRALWQAQQTSQRFIDLHRGELIETVILRVNWSRSRDEIREDLDQWLRPERRSSPEFSRKPVEKSMAPAALRQLASMRILHAMPWDRARDNQKIAGIIQTEPGRSTAARLQVKERMILFFSVSSS